MRATCSSGDCSECLAPHRGAAHAWRRAMRREAVPRRDACRGSAYRFLFHPTPTFLQPILQLTKTHRHLPPTYLALHRLHPISPASPTADKLCTSPPHTLPPLPCPGPSHNRFCAFVAGRSRHCFVHSLPRDGDQGMQHSNPPAPLSLHIGLRHLSSAWPSRSPTSSHSLPTCQHHL